MYQQKLITDYYFTNYSRWPNFKYMKNKFQFIVNFYGQQTLPKIINEKNKQCFILS